MTVEQEGEIVSDKCVLKGFVLEVLCHEMNLECDEMPQHAA